MIDFLNQYKYPLVIAFVLIALVSFVAFRSFSSLLIGYGFTYLIFATQLSNYMELNPKKFSKVDFTKMIVIILGIAFVNIFNYFILELPHIGIFIGSLMLHIIPFVHDNRSNIENIQNTENEVFVICMVKFVAHITNMKKEQAEENLKLVEYYVNDFLTGTFAKEQINNYKFCLKKGININSTYKQAKSTLDKKDLIRLIFILMRFVYSDKKASDSNFALIVEIANGLNLPQSTFDKLFAMFVNDQPEIFIVNNFNQTQEETSSPEDEYEYSKSSNYAYSTTSIYDDYAVLELSSSATDEEVKKAFRTLAKKYHPDTVNQNDESALKTASENFKKISESYERIKDFRGIS